MEKACDTWKSGLTLKGRVKSARRPVNMELERKTSFWTSRAMLSTVPGFDSPNASRRLEKDKYVSRSDVITALFLRKPAPLGASFSSAIVVSKLRGSRTNPLRARTENDGAGAQKLGWNRAK